jgi:hypothetical protein
LKVFLYINKHSERRMLMLTFLLLMQAAAGEPPANKSVETAPVPQARSAYHVCAAPPVAPFSSAPAAIRQAWVVAAALAQAQFENAKSDAEIAAAQTRLDIAKSCAATGQYHPPAATKSSKAAS